jgi:soluble lytic murein transglycosylase-like protein
MLLLGACAIALSGSPTIHQNKRDVLDFVKGVHMDVTSLSPPKTKTKYIQSRLAARCGRLAPLIQKAARKYNVSPELISAVILTESGGKFVVSSAGAIGVMQLMPATAWSVLHVDPWNTEQNILGGVHYLKMLVHQYKNVRTALLAYNAGPTAVNNGRIPAVSVQYANKVLQLAIL